jgi:hypothetical protein
MLLGDNHDMDRLFMQLNQNVDLMQMAFLLFGAFTIWSEILMDNTGHHKVDG